LNVYRHKISNSEYEIKLYANLDKYILAENIRKQINPNFIKITNGKIQYISNSEMQIITFPLSKELQEKFSKLNNLNLKNNNEITVENS